MQQEKNNQNKKKAGVECVHLYFYVCMCVYVKKELS